MGLYTWAHIYTNTIICKVKSMLQTAVHIILFWIIFVLVSSKLSAAEQSIGNTEKKIDNRENNNSKNNILP